MRQISTNMRLKAMPLACVNGLLILGLVVLRRGCICVGWERLDVNLTGLLYLSHKGVFKKVNPGFLLSLLFSKCEA